MSCSSPNTTPLKFHTLILSVSVVVCSICLSQGIPEEKYGKATCRIKFDTCMESDLRPRPTAAECDDVIRRKYGCPAMSSDGDVGIVGSDRDRDIDEPPPKRRVETDSLPIYGKKVPVKDDRIYRDRDVDPKPARRRYDDDPPDLNPKPKRKYDDEPLDPDIKPKRRYNDDPRDKEFTPKRKYEDDLDPKPKRKYEDDPLDTEPKPKRKFEDDEARPVASPRRRNSMEKASDRERDVGISKSRYRSQEDDKKPKPKKYRDDDDDRPPPRPKEKNRDDDDDRPSPRLKGKIRDNDDDRLPPRPKEKIRDDDDERLPTKLKGKIRDNDDDRLPPKLKGKIRNDDDDRLPPRPKEKIRDDDDDRLLPRPKEKIRDDDDDRLPPRPKEKIRDNDDDRLPPRLKEKSSDDEPYTEIDQKTKTVADNYSSKYRKEEGKNAAKGLDPDEIRRKDKVKKEKEQIFVKEDLIELEDIEADLKDAKQKMKKPGSDEDIMKGIEAKKAKNTFTVTLPPKIASLNTPAKPAQPQVFGLKGLF